MLKKKHIFHVMKNARTSTAKRKNIATLKNGRIILFQRKFDGCDELGKVIDCSKKIFLIARITDVYTYDGYSLILTSDIISSKDLSSDRRIKTAMLHFGLALPSECQLDLDVNNWKCAFSKFPKNLPVAVHAENKNKLKYYVGIVKSISLEGIKLRTVSTDGVWGRSEIIKYEDITRVDFSGRYESIVIQSTCYCAS